MIELYKLGGNIEAPYFKEETDRQKLIFDKYQKIKNKHKDKWKN